MRHLVRYAFPLLLLSLLVLAVATWSRVNLISADHGTWLRLHRASLEFWHGSPGDWPHVDNEWVGPRRAFMVRWAPEFKPMHSIIYFRLNPSRPAATPAIVNYGTRLILPLWIPVALFFLLTAAGAWPWYLHRRTAFRRRRNRCVTCAYDLVGVKERCPECGGLLARVVGAIHAHCPLIRAPIPR